jgi:hypothetical protein
MVYSTGCVAEDSWRRGGWCALVGKGFVKPFRTSAHQPPILHESSATQPVLVGGWCALVGNGFTVVKPFPTSAHQPPLLHESSAKQPVLYTIGFVDFVPFS